MIKILCTGMSTNLGGINTYLYNLYKNSAKEKFQFDFINSQGAKFALQDNLEKGGCRIINVTPRLTNYKKHIEELKNIFLNNEYDYIHINIMSFSWYEPIVFANKYSKAKIIVHSHCGNKAYLKECGLKTRLLNFIGKIKINNLDILRVACGEQAGKFMFGNKEFTVFNNGIVFDNFKFNANYRRQIRDELLLQDNEIVIGQVAKLEKQKNPLFLIDIFNEFHKLNKNSKLVIAGTGSLKNSILKRIEKYKLRDNVLLLGRREDANKLYSAFDLFIMPSIAEGFSISLVEAQVNGLKCYTTTCVDNTSNISGNVNFISLNKSSKQWAKEIYSKNNTRDLVVLKKISPLFDDKKSYEKVYEYYQKNLTK